MKKVIILALLIAAGSVFNSASAQSKKKNKAGKQNTECQLACKTTPVELRTPSDSVELCGRYGHDSRSERLSR